MLDETKIESALERMTLTDLWGVAGRLAQRLTDLGITTPSKLRDSDSAFIREHFSVVLQRMVLELRGVPCIAIEIISRIRKALSPRGSLADRS